MPSSSDCGSYGPTMAALLVLVPKSHVAVALVAVPSLAVIVTGKSSSSQQHRMCMIIIILHAISEYFKYNNYNLI